MRIYHSRPNSDTQSRRAYTQMRIYDQNRHSASFLLRSSYDSQIASRLTLTQRMSTIVRIPPQHCLQKNSKGCKLDAVLLLPVLPLSIYSPDLVSSFQPRPYPFDAVSCCLRFPSAACSLRVSNHVSVLLPLDTSCVELRILGILNFNSSSDFVPAFLSVAFV